MQSKALKNYLIIAGIVLFSSILLYLPFLLRLPNWFGLQIEHSDMNYIYRHYDGPLYIIPAKTWYVPQAIEKLRLELPISPNYFAAHLPLYPVFIALFATVFGFLKSIIIVNILFTILLAGFFYYLLSRFNLTKNPLLLTTIFLFLPRFLVVRSIGAPESMFMFFVLLSLFFFEKQKYLWAGIFGGISVMAKSPGMLLFFAYSLVFLEQLISTKKFNWHWFGILFIPLGLLAVFGIYANQYHDFFAYFHSGDNIHLVFPYSAFNYQKTWVGTAWLEDILFYFFMYAFTVITLKDSKYRSFFYFSLVFFTATIFVQHRDIARYSLPIWPLACIAFERFFTSKKFLIIFIILLPAIYLYSYNFLLYNVMPISNWAPFL